MYISFGNILNNVYNDRNFNHEEESRREEKKTRLKTGVIELFTV